MKNNKCYLLIIFSVIFILTVIGCKPMSDEDMMMKTMPVEKLKIGVCVNNYADTYASYVLQAIVDAGEAENVEVYWNDAKNDQATQNSQIDAMIGRGVDAIVMAIVDVGSEASETVIEKVREADIPVVFYNIPPDLDVIKKYDKACYVGTIIEEAGVIQGEIMCTIWNGSDWDRNGDGIMQYVMLMGVEGNDEAIARTKYSIDTVVDSKIKVEKLADAYADWNPDKAQAVMSEWFRDFGDKIEFIVANNDSMAVGTISVLNEHGYNTGDPDKYIPVVGVDATEEAVELINNGRMSGTVKQDAVAMGNAAVKLAINSIEGRAFLAGTGFKYDDTGVAIRIPYQPFTGK